MAKERTVPRSALIVVLFSALAVSQTVPVPPTPSDLLERARIRLVSEMSRQSRYTCTQNITRHFYELHSTEHQRCANFATGKQQTHGLRRLSTDKFQLDVAIAENREIHSWPGAFRFAEDEIRQSLSAGGPFGSGDFAGFIVGIFEGAAKTKFIKASTVGGRAAFEYAFEVPQDISNYAVSESGNSFTTAYSGSFLLDQDGDLTQLTVRTAEFPDLSNACHAASEIRYQRIRIRGEDVLIPRETELATVFRDGTETESTTSYSSCHEYTTHSVVRFDIPDVATEKPASKSSDSKQEPGSALPDGLIFRCKMETPHDTQVGSIIYAELTAPLVGESGETLAPIGAHIQGRLLRLAEYTNSQKYFEADVRLDTIEINGLELPLYAVPAREDVGKQASDFSVTAPRNVGAFFFDQKRLKVLQWDSTWRTAFPPTRKDRREVPDIQQSVSEKGSLREFVLALQYAQEATDLLNAATDKGNLKDNPNLPRILTYRQKAIDAGRSVSLDRLNDLYPDLGDRFNSQFLSSLILFVDSCNRRANSESVVSAAKEELSRSVVLSGEWSNWYEPLRGAIDVALRSSTLNSPASHEVADHP
jgi:hypothetical protein